MDFPELSIEETAVLLAVIRMYKGQADKGTLTIKGRNYKNTSSTTELILSSNLSNGAWRGPSGKASGAVFDSNQDAEMFFRPFELSSLNTLKSTTPEINVNRLGEISGMHLPATNGIFLCTAILNFDQDWLDKEKTQKFLLAIAETLWRLREHDTVLCASVDKIHESNCEKANWAFEVSTSVEAVFSCENSIEEIKAWKTWRKKLLEEEKTIPLFFAERDYDK